MDSPRNVTGGGGEGERFHKECEDYRIASFKYLEEALDFLQTAMISIYIKREDISASARELQINFEEHQERIQRLKHKCKTIELKLDKFAKMVRRRENNRELQKLKTFKKLKNETSSSYTTSYTNSQTNCPLKSSFQCIKSFKFPMVPSESNSVIGQITLNRLRERAKSNLSVKPQKTQVTAFASWTVFDPKDKSDAVLVSSPSLATRSYICNPRQRPPLKVCYINKNCTTEPSSTTQSTSMKSSGSSLSSNVKHPDQPGSVRKRVSSVSGKSVSEKSSRKSSSGHCCWMDDWKRQEELGIQLLAAAQEGKSKELFALIKKGAHVNFRNLSKWTALHMAVKKSQVNVISLLLEMGANVHARNNYGFTPLHMAAYYDTEGTSTYLLLDAGARLNVQNFSGRTPLHCAAESDNVVAVRALVLAGAATDLLNDEGKTPLDVAKNDRVRQVLVEANVAATMKHNVVLDRAETHS